MAYQMTEQHKEIVANIKKEIHRKCLPEQLPLLDKFLDTYYANVSDEDLENHNLLDLYGALLSHWNFLYQRKEHEIKVRVFNPQYEQDGWQSKHTIIEMVMPDKPFILDSLRMCLTRMGYAIHQMIHPSELCFVRNAKGQVVEVKNHLKDKETKKKNCVRESLVYAEIDQQPDEKIRLKIQREISLVLKDIFAIVDDWRNMQDKVTGLIKEFRENEPPIEKHELNESLDFLNWIVSNNFTFLGVRDYDVETKDKQTHHLPVADSGLGLLKDANWSRTEKTIGQLLPKKNETWPNEEKIILIKQLSGYSTIHRPSSPYVIVVRRFSKDNQVIGERHFVGLYTSIAYHSSPMNIPFLNRKVRTILAMSSLVEDSHAWKNLLNILETYPRDELLQASEEDLYNLSIGIYQMQERRRIRLFVRKDVYGCFYSCMIYVPRDQFNSALRHKMGEILVNELKGINSHFTTQFGESILARIHFIIKAEKKVKDIDVLALEKKLVLAARTWEDDLQDTLSDHYGESQAIGLYRKYEHAFPAGYKEYYPARTAVYDVAHIESLKATEPMSMSLYRPVETLDGNLHFKLFCYDAPIALSDILPMLENMGLHVIGERSHQVRPVNMPMIWVSDFKMQHSNDKAINVDEVRAIFQQSFEKVWQGKAENDGFNKLVLNAKLNWRQITVLRAYAKYMRQIGFTFSQNYIEETLARYPVIVMRIIDLFQTRFDINRQEKAFDMESEKVKIIQELDHVNSLDEDRIIRRYVDLIFSTIRTNYYQQSQEDELQYISFKINPTAIPEMPLPKPMFEIFVYSPRVEGVHLRSAKVARGGLRWSDRREDFRTEILGLMKAQQVKNAVIVPAGAKGGFVAKELASIGNPDEMMKEVISCYETFISGLLDLTDNLVDGEVIPPENTVRYDDDDYYLVVAADKGTATFSDIANDISKRYDFWLGDAFASGGKTGYDHKQMGITARGAWESVKSQFLELEHDVQTQPFTVVGVGDMGGDVFGNGMLCSDKIKLIAAFNHMHIFIDPDPNPEQSYEERKRMFALPRSTWQDYDKSLISKGGGVFNRNAKSVRLTDEIKAALHLQDDVIVPNELIKAILKQPVDLLFNGGIGTYVKGSTERNIDVGDRANDVLRINGCDLNCKVVAEGGNLGLTQLGRVEFALKGGIVSTDFIDNAGGVDCSDHEVNIKILLDMIQANGDLTEKQRNKLLSDMTNEIAELVLNNNYMQTKAISLAAYRAKSTLDEQKRFIHSLERRDYLDRGLEFLPSDDEIAERKANGEGLSRPELSVLLAYSKIALKEKLLESDLLEDGYVQNMLKTAFPLRIAEKFPSEMKQHRMRREIIATQLSNSIANIMGITFIKRLFDETGGLEFEVVRAYIIASEIFDMNGMLEHINQLDGKVPASVQMDMKTELIRLLRRVTRWFLRNRRFGVEISETITHFKPRVRELYDSLEECLVGLQLNEYKELTEQYIEVGVPNLLAAQMAGAIPMVSAVDIVEASSVNQLPVKKVAETYFSLGAVLQLDWFRREISNHRVSSSWDSLARAACKDDLDRQQRSITEGILRYKHDSVSADSLSVWMEENKPLVERWFYMVSDLKSTKRREFSMFAVALRELLDLAQVCRNISVELN